MFLCEQSPYPTGAPEGSELTRSSRTCVAGTLGALPGALIKLTCALITPGLSPLSSSVESCLFHPRPSRSKPPDAIERQFYLQARNTLYPSRVAVPEEAELNLTVHSTEDQQGKVVRPTTPHSASAPSWAEVTPRAQALHRKENTTNLGINACCILMKRSFLSVPVLTEILTRLLGEFLQPRIVPPHVCRDPSI